MRLEWLPNRVRSVGADRLVVGVVAVVGICLLVDLLLGLTVGRPSYGVFEVTTLLPISVPISIPFVYPTIGDGTHSWESVWRYLRSGVVTGLILGLAGIGLSMTYSILKFANFSHGDLVTAGAFSGWSVALVVGGIGTADLSTRILVRADRSVSPGELGITVIETPLSVLVGLLGAVALTILIALTIDRIVYKPMRTENAIALLIASVGAALALRYLINFVYTGQSRSVTPGNPAVSVFPVGPELTTVGAHTLTLVVTALALMAGTHVLLQYTKLGTAMRAMADNEDLALVTGIPTERVVNWTWIIGAGLTGAAGYLIVLQRGTIHYNIGWELLLLIFAAVILGGIGSIYGAIGGGMIIGLAESMSNVWIPSDFALVVAFLLMIVVLLTKPEGLFGGVTTA